MRDGFGMPLRLKKVSFIWLVSCLGIAVCLWWLYNHAGNKLLLPIAVRQIQELTTAEVILEGVDFHLNGTVRIDELLIKPGRLEKYDNTILEARTVNVRFKAASLLTLRPRLKEITVEDLMLNAQYDTDSGRWNIECLKTPRADRISSKWPAVIVKKGKVKCSRVSPQVNDGVEEILSLDIKAEFSQAHSKQQYNLSITTTDLSDGRLGNLRGYWLCGERSRIVLQGGLLSLRLPAFDNLWNLSNLNVELEYNEDNIYVKKLNGQLGQNTQISIAGTLNDLAAKGSFEVQARINNLLFTSEPMAEAVVYNRLLLEEFSPSVKRFLSQYNPNGLVDIELIAEGRLDGLSETDCLGRLVCRGVSFCHEGFPYKIDGLKGSVDFTANSAVLNSLRGKNGDHEIVISGYSKNFGPNWECQIQIAGRNVPLDDELYRALSGRQKKFWNTFSPSGAVRIDYSFINQPGGRRKHTLAAELLGGSAQYVHFPYPLKNLSGRFSIGNDTARISSVTSMYESRQITFNGEISGLRTDRPKYDIQINAEHILIDSMLKAALPEHQRRFYEQFEVDGFINVEAEVFNSEVKEDAVEYIANVTLDAEKISSDTFPLPMAQVSATDVTGRAIVTDELLQIEELTGRCGTSSISLSGRVWPRALEDEKIGYCLLLRAEELEINDNLVRVLSKGPAKVLAKLKGQGRLNISAELNHNAPADCPAYRIIVNCFGNNINFEKFSYPLKGLKGTLTITKEGIYLNDITAVASGLILPGQDTAELKLNGRLDLGDEDFQAGEFNFYAQNIPFDRRLEAVLDVVVPNVYEDISPSGRFDLDVESLKIFKADGGRDCVDFSGKVILKDCAFGPEGIINRLDGVLDMKWLYLEGLGFSRADVSLRAEELTIKGRPLSRAKTRINYDPDEGTWTARNFVADCYDGRVTADFELRQLTEGALGYNAWLGFENIDLKKFLMQQPGDENHDHEYTSGRMSGSLSVLGLSGDDSARTGRLQLSIRDMQVGRLSILAKMLSVLKLTAPGDFAFENMFIDSYIKQNQLLLKEIDIQGKVFCFRGSGRMDLLSKNVDLSFTASGSRFEAEPSLLDSLAEGLAPAAIEMKVAGHFNDAEIEITTLPVIKQTLGILGSKPAATGKSPGRN